MGKWSEKWSESDDTHDNWGRSGSHRADDYVSKSGDGDKHCHLWINREEGTRGIEHRGHCKVCDDEKGDSSSSSGK